MKYRLILTTLMLSIFSFGQGASALTPYFNDVNEGTPYEDSIYWTVNNGITSGYDDGSGNWGPDVCVTRAELLKMMVEYRMQVKNEVIPPSLMADDGFSDVNPFDWFYDYVRYTKTLEIVEGYSDGTFKPNNCVNRVEAMKVAVNTLMPGQEIDSTEVLTYWGNHGPVMVDMDKLAWYAPYARVLFDHALVGTQHTQRAEMENGYSQNYLNFFPAGDMTRKEVAYMMHQIDKYLDYNTPKPPPEPKEEWYDWDEYNISLEIPEGYFVHETKQKYETKNNMLIFSKNSKVTDEYDSGLSSLTFVEGSTYEQQISIYADTSIYYSDVATRGFYVIEGFEDYLLEVEGGLLIYHRGDDDDDAYLRNRILSSLVAVNSQIEEVADFPQQTDYYAFGNGHYNETLTLHDDNNILSVEVNYPGGCEAHDFELLWKGEADNPGNPNKVYLVDLYLTHDDEDLCEKDEAYSDRFDFDISAIKQVIGEGEITLRVHGGANGTQYIDYEI